MPAALAFEWDVVARILGLAAAAGLDLPVLLLLPWILHLLPWIAPPGTGVLGGLDSPALAALGVVLLFGWLLVRRLPVAGTVLGLLLAGAGVVVAALLPWLLTPAAGGGTRILESLAAVFVSGSLAGVRMGWRFIGAHPPATLPGSGHIRRRGWVPPALAGVLVVAALHAPGASGLLALGLLSLALWPGRGALRASGFAVGSALDRLAGEGGVPPAWALEGLPREAVARLSAVPAGVFPSGGEDDSAGPTGSPAAPDPWGVPAALLGHGGGGLRSGWLLGGIEGDHTLCFRYRTPMGAWDLDLGGADAEELTPGPLLFVRSIRRGEARYVLLLPPGPAADSIRRTDPVQRNL